MFLGHNKIADLLYIFNSEEKKIRNRKKTSALVDAVPKPLIRILKPIASGSALFLYTYKLGIEA
jgi:hypothetical protein